MNDLLICSGVVGSFNIMDIPYGALYIAQLAAELNRETLPEPFGTIAESRIDSCHFEFPDSTHATSGVYDRVGSAKRRSSGY